METQNVFFSISRTRFNQPLILHVPHSSTSIPIKNGFIVDDKTLSAEIYKLTDWYTDELFSSAEDIIIKAGFSRIFCDPERFTDDSMEIMAKVGMGVLYEKSDDGVTIRNVTPHLREAILNGYYRKHHLKLYEAVRNQLNTCDKALIVDCHSFTDIPFTRDLSQELNRPDFNIGTDPFHTSRRLIEFSEAFFAERGFSLGINWPYQGTMVPMEFYKKNNRVQSIMLEVNRKLYLKGTSNERSESFGEAKMIVGEYLNGLRRSFM